MSNVGGFRYWSVMASVVIFFSNTNFQNTNKIMIKANELRIGNLVSFSNQNWIVANIYPHFVEGVIKSKCKTILECKDIVPIPLTEKWLLKLGFFKYNNTFILKEPSSNCTIFQFSIWENMTYNTGELQPKIDYVHQLQNLYFALCSEELVFSTKP